jgi:hypothetical protein
MLVVPVESTAFVTVGYDEVHQLLQLEFRSGEIYHYFEAPPRVFDALLAAPSKGRYFHQAILGRHRFVRVTSVPPLTVCDEQQGGMAWLGQ